MSRPTYDSLKIHPHVGRDMMLFKDAQAGMPVNGMPPEVGQSPQVGNPDEMQAPESANHRQFEDDFGSLAYQFVNDRAPALIPYLLGFEVVDRNEDGSKAVGIFGYKVDDDFYYIPAFFLNNQVRGVDMILNKKTNQFVPLTEKWIDFIVNKHSIRIGSPANNDVRDTMRNPDLMFVQRPKDMIGKIAEDNAIPWTPTEAWEHIKEATATLLADEAFQEMLSGLVSKGEVEKSAESKYVKDFMKKAGGPECMSSLFKALHDVDFANAALSLYKDAEAFWTEDLKNASIHVDRMRKIAESKPKVRIVDSTEGLAVLSKSAQDKPPSDVGEPDKPLTVEENARQIIEHDFTIEDLREDDDAAKVTDDEVLVNFERRFQPPSGAGKYNFMMSDGMSREGIMLNAVLSPSCDVNNTLVVFQDDGNILAEACPRAIITTEFEEDSSKADAGDDLEKLFDKAMPMSDIEIGSGSEKDGDSGKTYLFIDSKGNAAGPFLIKFTMADGDSVRFATGYASYSTICTPAPSGLSESYGFMDWNLSDRFHDRDGRRIDGGCDKCECEGCPSDGFITIGSFSGMPKKTSAGILLPKDWKALEIKKVNRYAPYISDESDKERRLREAKVEKEWADMKSKYTFASAMDILECMKSQGVERIKVASDGVEYFVAVDGAKRRHGPMNYKSAAIDLVTRFGFRPRRAFDVLSKVASGKEMKLLVQVPSLSKSAQDALVNVAMPAPMEQLPAVDSYTGIPVYTSPYIDVTHGQFTGVPGLPPEGGLTKGINMGGEMERSMGSGEYPDEHTDSMQGEALPIDEEARRLAEEAAAAGQRHVFDQAAIGGLAKVYDTANVVDSYIPDFMDTIDRLGRILFLFYWKHEDFNQRYGSDDVVQMEDQLRNVFKQMGELTLHLKEKAVQKD